MFSIGFSGFVSSASNVSDLLGPSRTTGVDLGLGPYQGGVQESHSATADTISLSAPDFGLTFGAASYAVTTDTMQYPLPPSDDENN